MATTAKLTRIIILLTWSISTTIMQQSCLCKFDNPVCLPIVQNGTTFYEFFTDTHSMKNGIIQCWDIPFIVSGISLTKCHKGERFSDVVSRRRTILQNSPHLYLSLPEEFPNRGLITACVLPDSEKLNQNSSIRCHFQNFCQLRDHKKIRLIVIDNVNINFDEQIFDKFTSLAYLFLRNVTLRTISSDSLPRHGNLKVLSLTDNNIEYLPSEIFINNSELQFLNLVNNGVKFLELCTYNITSNYFKNFQKIEMFNVGHNRISQFCFDFFKYANHLRYVSLEYNEMTTLEGLFLSDVGNITEIDLRHNKLQTVTERDFTFLHALETLNLASNHINNIEKMSFKSLHKLRNLILDNNILEFKYDSAPYFPSGINLLAIKNNYLETIPQNSFDNLIQLQYLYLSGNRISYVSIQDFHFMFQENGFKEVGLQDNLIVTFDLQEISYNTTVTNDTYISGRAGHIEFNLNKNPFRCDCSAKKLRYFIPAKFVYNEVYTVKFSTNYLYCNEPEELQAIPLKDIREEFLQCDDELICPAKCTCNAQHYDLIVNCQNNNFSSIPINVPMNATTLIMNSNPLTSLQNLKLWNSLQILHLDSCSTIENALITQLARITSLSNLKLLSIENNTLSMLPHNVFKNLSNLRVLKLGHNYISSLPVGLIASLTFLKEFHANNNDVTSLSSALLDSNIFIETIRLSYNKLSVIQLNMTHLNRLNLVDLSYNILHSINVSWPSNVKVILLSYNHIQSINFLHFPTGLHYLDLSYNHLVYIKIDEMQNFNQGLVLDLTNNVIISVYFQIIADELVSSAIAQETIIHLGNNTFSCDCKLESFISYLEMERMSNAINQYRFEIDDLFCATPAFMIGSRVSNLKTSMLLCKQDKCAKDCACYNQEFTDYKIIQCLNIPQYVDNITDINELHVLNASVINLSKLTLPVWHSLRKISIRNFVDFNVRLSEQYFSRVKNLISVTLTEINSLQFGRNVFSNFTELIYLDLSSNGVSELPSSTFKGSIQLKYLNLSHNLLLELPNDLFSQLTQLLSLDISYNQLFDLGLMLFTHLEMLENLHLQNNKLEYLPEKILTECNFLKVVDLSRNSLISSTLHFLIIPNSVIHFNLSNNQLVTIEDNWRNLRKLKILDLSFNQILTQNLKQLTQFPHSCSIFLQGNNISTILSFDNNQESSKTLKYTDLLEDGFISISLANNPFICDCNLKNFIHFLSNSDGLFMRFIDSHEFKCMKPTNLINKTLQSVEDRDLYCDLKGCPSDCDCRHTSDNEINIVNCNIVSSTNLELCPPNVDKLSLNGEHSLQPLKNSCWKGMRNLQIKNNSFTQRISEDFLYTYPYLENLSLTENNLNKIPEKFFWFSSNLKEIDFSKNNFENISHLLFANLNNLMKLDFSCNRFKKIIWQIPISVQYLNLAQNNINTFNFSKLNQRYQLQILNMSHNNLYLVERDSFFLNRLIYLRSLDLSYNKISINCYNIPPIFPFSLQSLNISHNNLNCTDLWSNNKNPIHKLRHIDYSYNRIKTLQLNDFMLSNNNQLSINLKNCKIRNYSFVIETIKTPDHLLLTIDVSNNKNIECDCNISHYQIPRHEKFNSTLVLQITTRNKCTADKFDIFSHYEYMFELPSGVSVCVVKYNCPSNCTCLREHNVTNTYCIQKQFHSLPVLIPTDVNFVNFDFNNITLLCGLTHPKWITVIGISVRYNKINALCSENISLLSNLTELHLVGNQLQVPSGWLENLVISNYLSFHLTLSDNPWSCECNNLLFQKWLIRNSIILIDDALNITCNGNLLLNFDMCLNEPLHHWKEGLPIVLICVVTIVISFLIVFYYRKKDLILAWLYGKNMCGWCIDEEEIDVDKEFDAFLSYCDEDAQYVAGELLPKLENEKPFYRICIHERDWIAGYPIVEQIESSVINSRRVIIVLSQHYVKSMWANLEFKFANYHSIKDKINRVIVIILNEDFAIDELDPEFRAHLRMNTYLKATDTRFWSKLRYVMPHKRIQQRRENIDRGLLELERAEAEY